MRRGTCRAAALLATAAWLVATPAQAQHTDDNAVASAEDAFGTSVGHETIGIYDENNVRGFSPGSAGNFRMEGMYFDIQGGLGSRIIGGETIRVGPGAQGYAFPAPTGIVELTLRKPDGKLGISPLVSTDSFGSLGFEADAQIPLNGEKLGIAAGVGLFDNKYANGGDSSGFNLGGVLRWHPSQQVEILAFGNHQEFHRELPGSIYIPTGNFLPYGIVPARNLGPDWARTSSHSDTFGMVGRAYLGDWTLRAGLFHSQYGQGAGYSPLVFVNPDMTTDRQVFARPGSGSASWSGELRLSRRFTEGPRRHMLSVMLRGRSVDGTYGGGEMVDLGTAGLNDHFSPPPPTFHFGTLTRDATRQLTGGASYSLLWNGIGEVTIGAMRTRYEKRVAVPGQALASGSSLATLPYVTAVVPVDKQLSFYGSWMRGLEDAGTAPNFASNANQVMPAIRTRQWDLGLHWTPVKGTSVILGYFAIAKPYLDLDHANHFGVLAEERHRGVELSVTSDITKNLRIVAGGVFQHPTVTALPTIATPVGAKPVNQPEARTRFNVNWTLPFAKAISLDAYVNHDSSAVGTVDNTVVAHGSTRVGVGARYRFKLAGKPFTARVQLFNLFDAFELVPLGSGVYGYNTKRNVTFYLTADF